MRSVAITIQPNALRLFRRPALACALLCLGICLCSHVSRAATGPAENSARPAANKILDTIDNDDLLHAAIEAKGIVSAARYFQENAAAIHADPSHAGERSLHLLQKFSTILREELRPKEERIRWNGYLVELRALRHLEASLHNLIRAADALLWLEDLHRQIEADLTSNPSEARQFLAEHGTSLDALWLRVRLDRIALHEPAPETLLLTNAAEVGPNPILDHILRARIAAYAAADGYTRKTAMENYCAVLTSLGLGREVEVNENQSVDWAKELHKQPGCISVRFDDSVADAVVRISTDEDLQMAFDSVVRAHGVNVSINSRSFDGSLFDLSAPETHRASERSVGGSLTIDVRHSEHSLLPGFVSLGMDIPGNAEITADQPQNASGGVNGMLSFLVDGTLRSL